jgi:hypothetical protein
VLLAFAAGVFAVLVGAYFSQHFICIVSLHYLCLVSCFNKRIMLCVYMSALTDPCIYARYVSKFAQNNKDEKH